MRTLQKKRPAGDPSRYEDFRRAVRDLEHAHRFFQYLHSLGRGHQLDTRKLQQHINFVAKTHGKALVRPPSCCQKTMPDWQAGQSPVEQPASPAR